MSAHARDRSARSSSATALPLAAAASIVVLLFVGFFAATPHAAAAPRGAPATGGIADPRSLTDAQLAHAIGRLEAEATSSGERLLAADAAEDAIERDRDAAKGLLGVFIAEAYKEGASGGSILTQVFGSGDLREAADRMRVAQIVGEHHGSLIRSLNAAEGQLDLSRLERARLITRLAWVQHRVVVVSDEGARRDAIRASHERDRAAKAQVQAQKRRERDQASAAAAGAAVVAGTLVSGGSSSPFIAAGGPPSAALIDAYLASKGSPMTGQGAAFMKSGARWQVDPRLLVAIAGAESSFGQVVCGPNNAWGWACPNDPADFATWADGIDTVMSGLRRYYLDEGRTSVSLIQQKYCPVGAANDPTGLNSHWAQNVTKFLVELGGNPAMVGLGPATGALPLPSFGGIVAID